MSLPVSTNLKLSCNKVGAKRYTKVSYPIRYGCYHEIRSRDYLLQCNLRGEIKYLSGLHADWPHPSEWLKHSEGGDWVYYSTGGYYTGVSDLLGEYYLPCFRYPSNSLFSENPFSRQVIKHALAYAEEITVRAPDALEDSFASCERGIEQDQLLLQLGATSGAYYARKKKRLSSILGADITVLPPDSRHVDYEFVPLVLADGCLYHCDFCTVKAGDGFRKRSRDNILAQLEDLADYYGADLLNYNSLFMGQHDSLAADGEDLLFAAMAAFRKLRFGTSHMLQPRLFLFGSVHSFFQKEEHFWADLNNLPYKTFINLGLESFDRQTLSLLGKPLDPGQVQAAFRKALQVSKRFPNIEVSVNFVLGENLPDDHLKLLAANLGKQAVGETGKLTVYCSPLMDGADKSKLLYQFRELKRRSFHDTWLYLIQRL